MIAAGIFLVAHGLLHLAIWLPPSTSDSPFDPRHSWAFGDVARTARGLALLSCGLFVAAGILLLSGSESAAPAVVGSFVSGSLIVLTFTPWFVGALVINAAIVVVALT
jgi:hypothetical protein